MARARVQEMQTEREVQAGIAREMLEGHGVLNASDSTWSQFKVAVTEGTFSYHTLDALGITQIDLMGDATHIELPDGSVITGQTTVAMNGQTGAVGS